MKNRIRSRWVSYLENPLFGMNLCGFEGDRQGVVAEIEAVEDILCKQPWQSVLAVLDIARTNMTPELVAFIQAHSGQEGDPIRKLAIIGVPEWKKIWYRYVKKVAWPKKARFFDEHEKAKAWLVGER